MISFTDLEFYILLLALFFVSLGLIVVYVRDDLGD